MSYGTDFATIRAHKAIPDPYRETHGASEAVPLRNSIHSLWRRQNFCIENGRDGLSPLFSVNSEGYDDPRGIISHGIYQRMVPALQLASLFHRISEPFFIKVYRAEVVGRYNFPIPLLDSEFDCDERERQAYTTMLASLSNTLRIYTGFREDDPIQNVNGSTNALANQRVPVFEQNNSQFIDWYSKADHDAQNVQKKNMIEHAHAVWKMRNHAIFMKAWGEYKGQFPLEEFVRRASPTEPLVSLGDREPELGMS